VSGASTAAEAPLSDTTISAEAPLSDATTAADAPLTGVSAIPPRGGWEFFVRAARPAGIWVCILILAVRGVALPLLQHFSNRPVDALDWTGVVGLAGMLGLAALRSFDKAGGTS
jgi:hypothetical protein